MKLSISQVFLKRACLFCSLMVAYHNEFHARAFSLNTPSPQNQVILRPAANIMRQKSNLSLGLSPTSTSSVFNDLDIMYTQASDTIKCPFIKRRVADTIDAMAMILKFLVIRHKSIWSGLDIDVDYLEKHMQAPGCKAIGRFIKTDEKGHSVKHRNQPIENIKQIVVQDWSVSNNKGYYINGKLNSTIYRDDCLFSGPDPDQPVRGLRKYLAAASNLFDASQSYATLVDVNLVDDINGDRQVIEVRWKLEGVLMLPWRPKIKPWSGWTKYHLDDESLIEHHEEGWDISVLEAFVGTILPKLGDKIWVN